MTKSQNNSNLVTKRANNTTGVRGVHSWDLPHGTSYWVARVHKGGRYIYRKSFRKDEYSLEEVAAIIEEQRKIHFGEYAGKNT